MKLKKEFEDFYKCIRIDSEAQNLIDKRVTLQGEIKDKFPTIMKNHDIELNKSDIRMIDQGILIILKGKESGNNILKQRCFLFRLQTVEKFYPHIVIILGQSKMSKR